MVTMVTVGRQCEAWAAGKRCVRAADRLVFWNGIEIAAVCEGHWLAGRGDVWQFCRTVRIGLAGVDDLTQEGRDDPGA